MAGLKLDSIAKVNAMIVVVIDKKPNAITRLVAFHSSENAYANIPHNEKNEIEADIFIVTMLVYLR